MTILNACDGKMHGILWNQLKRISHFSPMGLDSYRKHVKKWIMKLTYWMDSLNNSLNFIFVFTQPLESLQTSGRFVVHLGCQCQWSTGVRKHDVGRWKNLMPWENRAAFGKVISILGGGFKHFWDFTPIWGKWSDWTSIFFRWVGKQTTN